MRVRRLSRLLLLALAGCGSTVVHGVVNRSSATAASSSGASASSAASSSGSAGTGTSAGGSSGTTTSGGPTGTSTGVCLATTPSVNDVAEFLYDGGFDGGCGGQCDGGIPNNDFVVDFTGTAATFSPNVPPVGGVIPTGSDFSQQYGINGRSCFSCHSFDDGWTLSTFGVQQEFQANGTAASNDALPPVFRPVDGANSPDSGLATADERAASYTMLYNRAVIRVGIGVPANAEFTLTAVDDPYSFATANELSLYRRPFPTQNLKFESDIMWDGRETVPCNAVSLALGNQANDAILSHAQATAPLTPEVRQAIVAFESTIFAAQTLDFDAGPLDAAGALGGPENLSTLPFYIGMNDSTGQDPDGGAFNPVVFTLFDAWANQSSVPPGQAAILRGQALFNSQTFAVTGVRGLNDDLGQTSVTATCSTCHDTPNIGNNSLAHRYDIGISDADNRDFTGADAGIATLPLYTFTNNTSGETIQTTDPGRALISGQWKDMNRFKVPALRNLGAGFPYFHNGMAFDLAEVVAYHNSRFNIGLTAQQQADLVFFLQAL